MSLAMDRDASQTVYFDAVLTPNQSLSPRAFTVIMACVAGLSFLSGMAFLSMGAFPVVGFFGLDALAIYLAFRWHRKGARETTRIVITADEIAMHHVDRRGERRSASVPSAFARVELPRPVGPQSWLTIAHGQRAFVIGRFLTPRERASLADALLDALGRARAERFAGEA